MAKPLNPLRTSYTILDLFDKGRIDDALKCHFGLWQMVHTNQGMLDGREWHEKWAKESEQTGKMPELFGGEQLGAPIIEKKFEIQVNDWLVIVFKADIVDGTRLKEFKTGISESGYYLGKKQLPLYGALLELMKHPITLGEVHHYNQHTDKVDVSYLWLTPEAKAEALEWAIDRADKLRRYIIENKVTRETMVGVVANS